MDFAVRELILLIDTGACISLINQDVLKQGSKLNTKERVRITGVGEGEVQSFGTIEGGVMVKGVVHEWKFHVTQGRHICGYDGILGQDFLNNRAFIDCVKGKNIS